MKDHEIAKLVNDLRNVAVKYGQTEQLRERIAQLVVPVLKRGRDESAATQDMIDWHRKSAVDSHQRAMAAAVGTPGRLALVKIADWHRQRASILMSEACYS